MITTCDMAYEADGLTMVGHLARPEAEGPWPTVLVGHDGVGLESYQRSRCDDLARRGYLALAMDYHGGRVFIGDPDGMLARLMPLMADEHRMLALGRAGLDVLLAQPGADRDRLAGVGFGGGGRIVLELVRAGVGFKGVAVIHPGLPDARPDDWLNATGSILLCTGSADPLCTPEQILTFGRALGDAGLDWRANIYGGAQHAFWAQPKKPDGSPADATAPTSPTVAGVRYHPTHTPRAWRAVLDLLHESIGSHSHSPHE